MFMVNVGKYTVRPMDGMGYFMAYEITPLYTG